MSDFLSALPDVVAETILWRLPVKSILQCRCVCKSWYSLITSPNFISTHLRRKTLTTKNPQIFLDQKDFFDKAGNFVLLFDHQDYIRSMSFHIPIPNPTPSHCIQIVGSVNGLICFSFGIGSMVKLMLCNPIIGHFQSITPPCTGEEIDWKVKGFGFDERTLDFNILLISRTFGFIYSLNSNSWMRITALIPENSNMLCNSVHFVNGRFHWLASCHLQGHGFSNFIVAFDVKNEAFSHISLPKCLENSTDDAFRFIKFGESSIAIFQYRIDDDLRHVWIMKEYGSVESWMKLTVAINSQVLVLGFRNMDEVLIRYKIRSIASQKIDNYKLELQEVERIMDLDNSPTLSFTAHCYVPSLVLLDKQNNVDVAAPTHKIVDIAAPTCGRKRIRSNSQS